MSAEQQFDTDGRYVARTGDLTVRVKPVYLAKQSEPSKSRYVWAYEVTIENDGEDTVQLLDRYWHITDGNGRVEEVEGPGVIGKQPILKPAAARSARPAASWWGTTACCPAPASGSASPSRPSPSTCPAGPRN